MDFDFSSIAKDAVRVEKARRHRLSNIDPEEVSLVTEPAILTEAESLNHEGFTVIKNADDLPEFVSKFFASSENEVIGDVINRLLDTIRKKILVKTKSTQDYYVDAIRIYRDRVLMGPKFVDAIMAAEAPNPMYFMATYTQLADGSFDITDLMEMPVSFGPRDVSIESDVGAAVEVEAGWKPDDMKKAEDLAVGDFVSYEIPKPPGPPMIGKARVIGIRRSGKVQLRGTGEVLEATAANPVATLLSYYETEEDEWLPSDRRILKPFSDLKKLPSISEEEYEKALPDSVESRVRDMMTEHNAKYSGEGKQATMEMLRQVYNRGIGAYRTNPSSVRPNVSSAEQWAFARVRVFLAALGTGKFPRRPFDTDLLPKSHPASTQKSFTDDSIVTIIEAGGEDEIVEAEVEVLRFFEDKDLDNYERFNDSLPELELVDDGVDYDVVTKVSDSEGKLPGGSLISSDELRPNAAMRSAARRGLRAYEEGRGGDGLVEETIRRARRMAAGDPMPEYWAVVKGPAWFARHRVDWTAGQDDRVGSESPGFVAWLLWGGTAAMNFTKRLKAQYESRLAREKKMDVEETVAPSPPEEAVKKSGEEPAAEAEAAPAETVASEQAEAHKEPEVAAPEPEAASAEPAVVTEKAAVNPADIMAALVAAKKNFKVTVVDGQMQIDVQGDEPEAAPAPVAKGVALPARPVSDSLEATGSATYTNKSNEPTITSPQDAYLQHARRQTTYAL